MATEIRTTETSAQFVFDAIREQQQKVASNQVIAGGFIASGEKRQFTGAVFTCPSKDDVDAALKALIFGRETDIIKQVEREVKTANRTLYEKEGNAVSEGQTILENDDGRTVQSAVLSRVFESCQAKLATPAPLSPAAETRQSTPAGGTTGVNEELHTAPKAGPQQSVHRKPAETVVEKPEAPTARRSLPARPHKPKPKRQPYWVCDDECCWPAR